MALELLCRKIGMTQIYDDSGNSIGVTVLEAGPNTIVQKKTEETDGYTALQLGFGERRPDLFDKARRGHFAKANVAPKRVLRESRVDAESAGKHEVGSQIKCDVFQAGQAVDVIGTSKGRGYAGVVKRHNFAVKRHTHGTHEYFRHGGSIGCRSYPGKVIKGMRMAGQLGNERVTVRNAQVVRVDAERNLLFIRGGVPGHKNAMVRVRNAVASR